MTTAAPVLRSREMVWKPDTITSLSMSELSSSTTLQVEPVVVFTSFVCMPT